MFYRRAWTGVAVALLGVAAALPVRSAHAGPARPAAPARTYTVRAADGVTAEVSTAPFGLRFHDADGRTVLGSVAGGGAPTPTAAVGDLLGVLGNTSVAPTRYAPITFTVGSVSMTQQEQVPMVTGNPLLTVSAGVQYALTDVTGVRRLAGGGVRLDVATDDPSGRRAVVDVRPDRGPSLRTQVRLVPATGVAFVGAGFASPGTEAFHGFGGRRNAIDQSGQTFFNWIDQTVFKVPVLGGQPQTGWYQQAQFVSSHHYGFLLDRPQLSWWRMRSDRAHAWQVQSNSTGLDFTVAPGTAPRAIRTVTAITGRNPVPGRWQLGPVFSQTLSGGTTGVTPEAYEQQVRTSLEKISRLHLPFTSFAFEGWALLKRSGHLHAVIDLIRSHGLHPLVYFRAFAGNDGQGTEDDDAYATAVKNGYAATRADGSPYVFADTLAPGKSAVLIDFTNPKAVAWWRRRITDALDAGADGFMQDFGEQVMWDMHFADGSTGRTMHNRYAVLYHRTTRRIIDAWHRRHPHRVDPMFYVRSGYSGRPGSAAYESASWCGDYTSTWSRTTGLAALTTDMLNRSVGGAYGFQCDTGGYMDLLGRASRELFLRWSWYAALTPENRIHGGPVFGERLPWSFDTSATNIYRRTLLLHRAAEPYILRLWKQARRTGMPITRPLWLAYPAMPGVDSIDQEYLLGPDVLVAPVVDRGVTSWQVHFPPGCWRSPDTGRRFSGPRSASVAAPLTTTPYFFRCGTRPFTPPGG